MIYGILPIVRAPNNNPTNASTLGNVCEAPEAPFDSGLVLPIQSAMPRPPFDVANVPKSTVAVFTVLVCTVVAKVCWAVLSDSVKALSVKNTRAKPGAGTLIWHVLAFWSQVTVCMFSSPFRRPSEA
jgi:hypothetical protein